MNDMDRTNNTTCIMWASRSGHTSIVQLLLDNNANFRDQENYFGYTPVLWACKSGHLTTVEL